LDVLSTYNHPGCSTEENLFVTRACCVEFKFNIYNVIHVTYSIASEREL
jgi:hypothetical protein